MANGLTTKNINPHISTEYFGSFDTQAFPHFSNENTLSLHITEESPTLTLKLFNPDLCQAGCAYLCIGY